MKETFVLTMHREIKPGEEITDSTEFPIEGVFICSDKCQICEVLKFTIKSLQDHADLLEGKLKLQLKQYDEVDLPI